MRFTDDHFSQNYKQTVGCDFFIRRMKVPPNFEIALQIWDIGGQSIGSKMITSYISGLLCFVWLIVKRGLSFYYGFDMSYSA